MAKWRLGDKLGWGRFGTVYACTRTEDPEDARPVHAIKRLQAEPARVEEIRQRFSREIGILAALDHPNVMPVVDSGETAKGVPWLVMPKADMSLKEALESRRPGDEDWTIKVFRGVLAGVAHAHEAGVLHRDLKPSNILLFADEPKVSDFGIAKQLDIDGTTLTRSGQELGTLRYMAPEQLSNAKKAGPPADVYALGKILIFALTGVEPEPMKAEVSAVPESFRFFVDKCCRDDPDRRYADATEARKALDRLLAGDEVLLPPFERARQLANSAGEAIGTQGERAALEALDAHVRAHPEADEMHRRVMPRIARPVVGRWVDELPDGFREALRSSGLL